MSAIESELRKVLYDFVNSRFTKSMLGEMLKSRGIKTGNRKDVMIKEILKFYSPDDLLEHSRVIKHLRWFERLILHVLLSGPKTKREIAEYELVRKVLSHRIPEAAFGIITSKFLDEKKARRYLLRRVDGLKKTHLLIAEKKDGRRIVYSIHPWFLPYFKEKLSGVNGKELVEEAYRYAKSSKSLLLMDMLAGEFWPEWRNSLNNFRKTIKELARVLRSGESHLRFGVPAIRISLIARQYYCEKKVELVCPYGEEETKEMLLGREIHKKLLEGTEKINMESLWAKISAGMLVKVREMPLIAKYGDIFLIGMPDMVIFKGGKQKP